MNKEDIDEIFEIHSFFLKWDKNFVDLIIYKDECCGFNFKIPLDRNQGKESGDENPFEKMVSRLQDKLQQAKNENKQLHLRYDDYRRYLHLEDIDLSGSQFTAHLIDMI